MSLKAFHILFIASSILLCLGFCAWEIREYRADGGPLDLCLGLGYGISAILLAVYFRAMLKKLRGISIV